MNAVDDSRDANGHEDGQRDVLDAHNAPPVLVPGGEQESAQRGVGGVGEPGEDSENQVGDKRPGRHRSGFLAIHQSDSLNLATVDVQMGLVGQVIDRVGASQQRVEASGDDDTCDEENHLDERPPRRARRLCERRVGQKSMREGFAPATASTRVAAHRLDLR